MARRFRSDAQRKAVMSALARQKDKPTDYRKMTISQKLLVGVRKIKDPESVSKLFSQTYLSNPNLRYDKDYIMAYIPDSKLPTDPMTDRQFRDALPVVGIEQVPKSVFKEYPLVMLVNQEGKRIFINRRYLSHVKTYLGDSIYVKFSGEPQSPVFFVDRKTRSAIAIAPVYSIRLGLFGAQHDIRQTF